MNLSHIETPSLILQSDRLDRNIARMREHLARHGVALRPHLKTAKNIDIARRVLAGSQGAITVSTLKEAEYFADHGISDILYAVAIVPSKIAQIAALHQRGIRLSVILDSIAAAGALAEAARQHPSLRVPVLIEIDCDGHRAGIAPDHPDLIEIARILHDAPNTEFGGLIAHAGSSYNGPDRDAIRAVAAAERGATLAAAQRLNAAGHACSTISIGSTPTALFGENFSGITEVRAGVYMFFDLVMAGLGVCAVDDIALSVLSSVIGHQANKNQILIDAGWMALSRDRGTASQAIDQGYGVVCDSAGQPIDDLIVVGANQEHGIVASRSGQALDLAAFPIGTRLRILPNHACATAAQHTQYRIISGDSPQIVDTWPRFGGW